MIEKPQFLTEAFSFKIIIKVILIKNFNKKIQAAQTLN